MYVRARFNGCVCKQTKVRVNQSLLLGLCVCVCMGEGMFLVGAYRGTLKAEAAQHNEGGNGGEIHWNTVNPPYI